MRNRPMSFSCFFCAQASDENKLLKIFQIRLYFGVVIIFTMAGSLPSQTILPVLCPCAFALAGSDYNTATKATVLSSETGIYTNNEGYVEGSCYGNVLTLVAGVDTSSSGCTNHPHPNMTVSNTLVGLTFSDPVATVTGSPVSILAKGQIELVIAEYIAKHADLEAGSLANIAIAKETFTDINDNPQTVTDTDDEIVLAELPDLTPIITAIPNIMQGNTVFNLSVRVTELNSINTNGLITVKIPKDSRLSFYEPYNPNRTMLGTIPVNNSDWSFSEDATYYIFTSTEAIQAGGFSTFGFVAQFDPGQTKGVYTVTSQIESGSGGEIRIDNNVDSEKLDYFIN